MINWVFSSELKTKRSNNAQLLVLNPRIGRLGTMNFVKILTAYIKIYISNPVSLFAESSNPMNHGPNPVSGHVEK